MSLRKDFYNALDYTHKENNERFDNSLVSAHKKPEKITVEELDNLADAYDMTISEMVDMVYELY